MPFEFEQNLDRVTTRNRQSLLQNVLLQDINATGNVKTVLQTGIARTIIIIIIIIVAFLSRLRS